MRISTPYFNNSSLLGMQAHTESLYNIQKQLSSGQRVMTPGDDPVASARIYRAQHSIDTMDKLNKNGDFARNRLMLEDRALSEVTDNIQRIRELALQGLNGSYNAQDRKAMATEMRGLLQNMISISNTQDHNKEYIFAGDDSDTAPFTQNNDPVTGLPDVTAPITSFIGNSNGARFIQIAIDNDNKMDIANPNVGDYARVRISDNGNKVFAVQPNVNVNTVVNNMTGGAATGNSNIFETVSRLAEVFDSLGDALPDGTSDFVTEIDSSISNISMVRAEVGSRINRIDDQYEVNEDFKLGLTESLSELRDMDMVTGISDYQKILSSLQMSQLTYSKVSELSLFNYLR
jgi:flagellar hook-associated protein 3 FlgL